MCGSGYLTDPNILHPKLFFLFSHPGGSVSLPGVWESGCISGRLLDDLGGFTCMILEKKKGIKTIVS